ncbi:hypothetical protein CF319_g9063, partial [Tilletia indica]
MSGPSSKKRRTRRRGGFAANFVECVDCDGEADEPSTTLHGLDVPDMCDPPAPLPSVALQCALRTIRATLGATAAVSHPGEEGQDINIDQHSGGLINYGADADDNPFMADNEHEYDGFSDVGSGDEDADQMIPIVYSAVIAQEYIRPSRSRFLTWHTRVAAIFELLYGTGSQRRPSTDSLRICSCRNTAQLSTFVIEVYDVGPPYPVIFTSCRQHVVELLISHDLFPATPSRPQVAFTIKFIRLFQSLVNVTGISATGMAMVFQQLLRNGVGFRRERWTYQVSDALRKQLRGALTWLTVVERYCDTMALELTPPWRSERPLLDEDDLHPTLAQLADSCPACFGSFQYEDPSIGVPYGPQVIISIDGNFTQKRRAKPDFVSRQPFPPRRFLSQKQVREADAILNRARGTGPDQKRCVAKIRAADLSNKSGTTPYEINGVMRACCRHDIPLVFCDIDTPGERHHYAVALIRSIASAIGPNLIHLGVAYDIGCRFSVSEKVANALGETLKVTWVVPVFHVYGHTYSCQIRYNPRFTPGFGNTDGEGMERVWSGLASLITCTRSMHRGERRFALEERCRFISTERRVNLFDILTAKSKRLKAIELKAKKVLIDDFDPRCIPEHYQRVSGVSDGADTPSE